MLNKEDTLGNTLRFLFFLHEKSKLRADDWARCMQIAYKSCESARPKCKRPVVLSQRRFSRMKKKSKKRRIQLFSHMPPQKWHSTARMPESAIVSNIWKAQYTSCVYFGPRNQGPATSKVRISKRQGLTGKLCIPRIRIPMLKPPFRTWTENQELSVRVGAFVFRAQPVE